MVRLLRPAAGALTRLGRPTAAQRTEVARLRGVQREWRSGLIHILTLNDEFARGTIERQLAKATSSSAWSTCWAPSRLPDARQSGAVGVRIDILGGATDDLHHR